MDKSSEKKYRKLPKDTDPRKRSTSTSHRQEPSHPPSASNLHKLSDPGIQRKHHWQTVMQSSSDTPSPAHRTSSGNSKNISANPNFSSTAASFEHKTKSSASHAKRGQPSSRAPLRPVPIAPSGPVLDPREDNDGYRFECTEEGCHQRFRHRSSRSRHKKNCRMRKEHNKS